MKRHFLTFLLLCLCMTNAMAQQTRRIDRQSVVSRNNPEINTMDTLASLSVGNGGFAVTVDATGLQTFPEYYRNGVPLGTFSDWGWHSFANTGNYRPEDALEEKDFGRGHKELYSAQFKTPGRQHDASEWLRKNPHRLHLGCLGFNIARPEQVRVISQKLDMWTGKITSVFEYDGNRYHVETVCHPERDMIATRVVASPADSNARRKQSDIGLRFRVPYPSGGHSDDGCAWSLEDRAKVKLTNVGRNLSSDRLRIDIDSTRYFVDMNWNGSPAKQAVNGIDTKQNEYNISFQDKCEFVCEFASDETGLKGVGGLLFADVEKAAARYWQNYWTGGGFVDFGHVKDPRAKEIERRVILSQYLMAVNDAGDTPPQETGLTYNSWFGKFHLEMEWWHQAHFPLWGHPELLAHTLKWYVQAEPMAREIARRQGFKGVRWMKMTDPSAMEAPSNVGSYLIWQQPHYIYLADLIKRSAPQLVTDDMRRLVDETAVFMESFVSYDSGHDRYVLKGCIPAQETLKAATTVNPPYELSYWRYALLAANQWREEEGKGRNCQWDDIARKLSPLAFNADSLYLAAESATDTYTDERMTSDHPAILGALGILPDNPLINRSVMNKTMDWILENWHWQTSWGWDFPMTAMCAARLDRPDDAVNALVMPMQKNTYLKNGHNYQDDRLRCYLPGNGGLLTAVAMMCAGWDGTTAANPGWPKDWDVRWEGLQAMP